MGDFFSPTGLGTKLVSGIVPSAMNMAFSAWQQNKQNQFNREQIREQNEYNSPTATMNRMIAAGISPKAAQDSIAGVPTLGEQSSVATAAPPTATSPGTDFMSGVSSAYANDLVSSQVQGERAKTSMDFVRLGQELKESQQRIQESIANMNLTNAKTATEKMLKMFKEQEQPFHIQALETAYLANSIYLSSYSSMSPSERQRLIKDARNTWLNKSSYDAQKSFFDSASFHRWSRAKNEEYERDYKKYHYEAGEYDKRYNLLVPFANMLYKEYEAKAKMYGWSSQYTQFYFDNALQYFDNLREGLDVDFKAARHQKRVFDFWFEHPTLFDVQQAIGLGNNLVGTAARGGNLLLDVMRAIK